MIHILKKAEPKELIQNKRIGATQYSELSTETLIAIRKQLLDEQGYLCAYCMQRITLGTSSIEHFFAQNPSSVEGEATQTINYRNMLGVCLGNEHKGNNKKNLTCDKHRGNTELIIDPQNKHLVRQIKYKSDGTIYSDNSQINKDLNETLNLNYEGVLFKKNRKAVLDSLKRYIDKNFDKKMVPTERLKQWLDACYIGNNGTRDPFVGIVINYLEKRIQKGN